MIISHVTFCNDIMMGLSVQFISLSSYLLFVLYNAPINCKLSNHIYVSNSST